MAQAVRFHTRITSQVSESSATAVTKLTVTAAQLSTAGFSTNDDIIIFAWATMGTSSGSADAKWLLLYNSVNLFQVEARHDVGLTTRQRASGAMFRVDLGATIQDIEFQLRSNGTDNIFAEKFEIVIMRFSDLGTEGVDVFWNDATSDTLHGALGDWNTANEASITWDLTGKAVEDWVVIGSTETQINGTTKNHEMRMNLDSGTFLGVASGTNVPSEEGESSNEEKPWLMIDVLTSLAASEHTVAIEEQDDNATPVHDLRHSSLLIFRKDVWEDLYFHKAGDISVAADTDVQVATVTDALSATQDVVMIGYGYSSTIATDVEVFMWIREGGSTVIDPVTDQSGSGFSNGVSNDNTDQVLSNILAFKNISSGALDLDLFYHQDGAATETLHKSTFLVWGMELAAAGVVFAPASTARVGFQTSGAAAIDVQGPSSQARAGWQPVASGITVVQGPASQARAAWQPAGSGVTVVVGPSSTARAAWKASATAVAIVAAPASRARAAFRTSAAAVAVVVGAAAARVGWLASGAAITDVRAPASTARFAMQTSAAALVDIQAPSAQARASWVTSGPTLAITAPASTARVAWQTSGAGIVEIQAPTSTARAAWQPTGAGTVTLQGTGTARVAWVASGTAIIDVQAPTGQARASWVTSGVIGMDVDSGTAQARVAVKTSASGAVSAFFWRQDPTTFTQNPVTYTPVVPDQPNPLP